MVTTTNQIAAGIHTGISSQEYHAWELDKSNLIAGPISCSMLKAFAKSPFAWRWGPEKTVTASMRTGSLFDYALTEPEMLEEHCAVSPFESFRTKEAKAWKEANAHKLLVTEAQLAHAKLAANRVRDHEIAGPIVETAETQVAVVGDIGGIPAKCLLDLVPCETAWEETLWDYKTISGLDDESIRRTIGQFLYHWQGAFYRTLWNKVSPDRHCEGFGFIFQDRDTLEVRCVRLTDNAIAEGSMSVGAALKMFATAAHQGIVSRYRKTLDEVEPLPFQAMADEEWREGLLNAEVSHRAK